MNILMVASEATPFAKTGGLADVLGALPAALAERGEQVAVVLPAYRENRYPTAHARSLSQSLDSPRPRLSAFADCDQATERGRHVLLRRLPRALRSRWHLRRRPAISRITICASRSFRWPRSVWRAICSGPTFCTARLAGCAHAGLPQRTLSRRSDIPRREDPADHSQPRLSGTLPAAGAARNRARSAGCSIRSQLEFFGHVNFLKGGIAWSDAVSTVSKGYAREIQTPEYGFGLDGFLRRHGPVTGIVNGVDYDEWNPEHDPHIAHTYSADDLSGKRACKRALLAEFGLPQDDLDRPLLGDHFALRRPKGLRPPADRRSAC